MRRTTFVFSEPNWLLVPTQEMVVFLGIGNSMSGRLVLLISHLRDSRGYAIPNLVELSIVGELKQSGQIFVVKHGDQVVVGCIDIVAVTAYACPVPDFPAK